MPYSQIIAEFPDLEDTVNSVQYNFGSGEMTYRFNSVQLVKKKIAEAKKEGIFGSMFWALGHDVSVEHPLSLLRAINMLPENPVKITKPFDTLFLSSTFTQQLDLSEYFTSTEELQYSVGNTPDRHRYSIVGDILTITGDSHEDVAITQVEIRATSTRNDLNYRINPLLIVVVERPKITVPLQANRSNILFAKSWSLSSSNDPLYVPQGDSLLYTVIDGDTVIHFIGTVKDISQWNSLTLSYSPVGTLDLTKGDIHLEYLSDIDGAGVNMSVICIDKDNVYHSYTLPQSPNNWVKETISASDFGPAWQQPATIDFKNIVGLVMQIGGQMRTDIYSFALKRFEITTMSPIISGNSPVLTRYAYPSLTNGVLKFSSNLTKRHDCEIFSVRGERLWKGSLNAGQRV